MRKFNTYLVFALVVLCLFAGCSSDSHEKDQDLDLTMGSASPRNLIYLDIYVSGGSNFDRTVSLNIGNCTKFGDLLNNPQPSFIYDHSMFGEQEYKLKSYTVAGQKFYVFQEDEYDTYMDVCLIKWSEGITEDTALEKNKHYYCALGY